MSFACRQLVREPGLHHRRRADARARHRRDDRDFQRRAVRRAPASALSSTGSTAVGVRVRAQQSQATSRLATSSTGSSRSARSAPSPRSNSRASTSRTAGDTERVIGGRVTAGFFDVFNLPAAHGRVFTKEEDQPGREQVVVLSHRLWTRRFGSDPASSAVESRSTNGPTTSSASCRPRSTTRPMARSSGCRSLSRPSARRCTTSTTCRFTDD